MTRLLALFSLCLWVTAGACAPGKTGTALGVGENARVYEVYRQYMETLNRKRQQAGLPPLTVRSYEDFRRSPGTD